MWSGHGGWHLCSGFLRSYEHSYTQMVCLFSLHYHWPSQGLSVVLLWHIAEISNPCFLTFFLCTSHSSNLSQVREERFRSPFYDCYLAQLADTVALDIITCMKIPFSFRSSYEDWVGTIWHLLSLFLPEVMKYDSQRINKSQWWWVLYCWFNFTKSLFRFLSVTNYIWPIALFFWKFSVLWSSLNSNRKSLSTF